MSRKRLFLSVIVLLSSLSFVSSNGLHSDSGYLVLAPAVFRSGVDQTITVRLFEQNDPVTVKATIVDSGDHTIIASQESEIQGEGKLTLRVPEGVVGKATLRICGNCHEHATFRFQNSTTITIINKGTSAFVQTDKPIYKPSQTVYVNVYTVDRDLRPVTKNVTIYAKGPNDVKIIQWKDLKPACCGTVTVSFPLSDQPPLGEWKVYAELQGNTYNTSFEVGKYVLPKFDVTISSPQIFRDLSQCEEAIVRAQYSFGKPVKGTLEVNMTVRGLGYFARQLDRGIPTTQQMAFNGESRFSVCIQDSLGRHMLNSLFRGILEIWATVISEDGSRFSAFDDSTIVSRTYVELEFTSDTRGYFKHGMPFQGQIYASYLNGDPASNVQVEITVKQDGREVFITQELTSPSDGMIPFTIPALPQTTGFSWIEVSARVIAIEGAPVDRHQYLAVYHDLHSWHSPSRCYLLIEAPEHKITVNTPVDLSVKSTCSCDFTLYYEAVSRGDIVLSESVKVNSTNSDNLTARRRRTPQVVDEHICQTTIRIIPTPNMAPLAKVLVYYVRPNGEGVSDSLHLPVEPMLENNVRLEISNQIVKPRENVSITVRADEDSCVCLGASDKSLHFISPEYLLSKEEIFDELQSYEMDNLPFQEETYFPRVLRHRRSRRRRSTRERRISVRDSFHAFLETGLVVMTDTVALKHRQNIQVFSEIRRQSLNQPPVAKIRRKPRKLRSFFPETWYWKCFNVSADGENQLTLQVPDSITSWVVNAVGTSPNSGIGVAENIEVNTFKKFFVEFSMPYSAIRGEEMILPITAHNYLNQCTQVRLAVASRSGVTFPDSAHSSARRMVKHICIGPRSTAATTFKLLFSELGHANLLAVADAVEGPNLCCNSANKLITKETEVDGTDEILLGNVVGTDALSRKILVEPEGEARQYTHSVFFCPNERMNISTPPSTFHFVKFPKSKYSFNFLTKASSSVHVVLSDVQEKSSSAYEIVLGGRDNTLSYIQRNEQILASAETRGILSEGEFRAFWIDWTEGNIIVGYGMVGKSASEFLHLQQISEPVHANYVGLGSSGLSAAEFHLWSTDDVASGFSEVFQLDVPSHAIPGSVRGHATLIGDVMGPTLRNLNNLLKLPYGCGEQNMINFAPNIYILKYLQSTNQLTSDLERMAKDYLVQGYQRQLTYRRVSGAYSPFGDRDEMGSMWLTAFVMKSYAEAREFIYIDQEEIDRALQWIISHQLADGSFPAYGKILNKDVQSGINRKISLTAYVVIALLETSSENQDVDDSVERAVDFLGRMLYNFEDPYTAALTAYALTLAESMYAGQARMILLDSSYVKRAGGYRYWSLSSFIEAKFQMPNAFASFLSNTKQTVASAEIELASYALLSFTKSGDISTALPIVRWISQQRNSLGGFSSTQDTCTALQALSSYATLAYMGGVNLNISLGGPSYSWNVVLNNENSDILQTGPSLPLAPEPIPVFVKANGDGCALLQIHVEFNIPEPEDENEFSLQVWIGDTGSLGSSNSLLKKKRDSGEPIRPALVEARNAEVPAKERSTQMKVCGRWKNHGSSNMAVLEVPLLTGFSPNLESLNRAVSNRTKNLKRFEVENSNIIFYFDEISSVCKTCVTFEIRREYEVAYLSPKILKLYDYYEPGYESSMAYNIKGQNEPTDDGYPECKCYRECGYEGPRACGDDGVLYENLCRMEMKSCEIGVPISQQDDSACEVLEEEENVDVEGTVDPPLLPPENYSEEYSYYPDEIYEDPASYADLFANDQA